MTVRLEQLIQQPYASLSAAISSFTGQNIGAHRQDQVRRGLRVGVITTALFSAIMCVVMYIFGRPVLGIFGDDGEILSIAVKAIKITSCFYFPLGMIYLIRGLSNGAGDSLQVLLNGIVEIICRIGLGIFLTRISPWACGASGLLPPPPGASQPVSASSAIARASGNMP